MAAPSFNWVLTRGSRYFPYKREYVCPDMTKSEDYKKAKLFKSRKAAIGVRDGFGLREFRYVAKPIPNWML